MGQTGAERQRQYMQRLRAGAARAPRVPDELVDALAGLDLERFLGDDAVVFAERVVAVGQRMLAAANRIAARRHAVSDGSASVPKRAVAGKPSVTGPASGPPIVTDGPDRLLAAIHDVLKRGTWQHTDTGLADRIALGELFLDVERGIVTDIGPKPAAPGKRKLWQTKVDNAMQRFIARAKKQDGYYVATLGLKGVRGFIKEGKAAR